MEFVEYLPEADFHFFLQHSLLKDSNNYREIWELVHILYDLSAWGAYQKALFLTFLLYVLGDETRMITILRRLDAVQHERLVPMDIDTFLQAFVGIVPSSELIGRFQSDFEKTWKPALSGVEGKLKAKAAAFARELLDDFLVFFDEMKHEFLLAEKEIHSIELTDAELENKALRWEYKFLGRDERKIEDRRKKFYSGKEPWLPID